VQHPIRLGLSLTGIAALALASLPFAISPAAAESTGKRHRLVDGDGRLLDLIDA